MQWEGIEGVRKGCRGRVLRGSGGVQWEGIEGARRGAVGGY